MAVAACDALISLDLTIQGLQIQAEELRRSLHVAQLCGDSLSRLEAAQGNTELLRSLIMKLESSFDDALFTQIIEAAFKLETTMLQTQLERDGDVEVMEHEINSFNQWVYKIEMQLEAVGGRIGEDDEDDEDEEDVDDKVEENEDASSSIDDVCRRGFNMVGLDDEYNTLLKDLTTGDEALISLVGMAGIGKTALAMELLKNPIILKHFDRCVYVKFGPKYKRKRILLSILSQLGHDIEQLRGKDYSILVEQGRSLAKKSVADKRCLFVLDDMWDKSGWYHLKVDLEDLKSRSSRVLVTTRLEKVAITFGRMERIRFLSKDESWALLCQKVFGVGQSCPFQLEKPGRKIAELCEGLPLAIITVARILSKAEKTEDYWEEVAGRRNSVFMEAEEEMLKVLAPSYIYLPMILKPCFLHMGIFPARFKIRASKLINLWIVENLCEPYPGWKSNEYYGFRFLEELVLCIVVILDKEGSVGKIKTCRIHSAFRHLCIKEARTNKFFHAVSSYADSFDDGIRNQRRVSMLNNVVFSIKAAHNSMNSISTVRSVLCTGPYHPYTVPICFGLRFVRVLDVITIRFYEFPKEAVNLIWLRYFALTCNGKIPRLISKLSLLQYLIIRRHLSIIDANARKYFPKEIWDMKELRHVHFDGGDILEPVSNTSLQNLVSLSGVSSYSCTKRILESIPNLKKLGVRIELAPDATDPMHCFEHLSHLDKLESLKCVITNPNLRSEVVPMPSRRATSIFPPSLKKLTLCGLGYSWKYINVMGSLPNLKVLKLQCYPFKGPECNILDNKFMDLRHLQIEDSDLKQLRAVNGSLAWLHRLVIKHCYKLEEISLGKLIRLQKIEFTDCNPLAVSCAEHMRPYGNNLEVHIHSSKED